jgi:CheY-like chemotaxis protein
VTENRKPAIVLVDDEEMILTSIRTLLMLEADYEVACFTSPLEAVQYLEKNAVDVTVSDYMMPGMTGIQLLAEAKRTQPARKCPKSPHIGKWVFRSGSSQTGDWLRRFQVAVQD